MPESNIENANKKKGLGRGLGSLLGGSSEQVENVKNPTAQLKVSRQAPAASSQVVDGQAQVPQVVSTQTSASSSIDPESRIWKVGIDKLSSGQYQPRHHFKKEALQELSQSIKENGILQPIVARRTQSGKLEIVAGERRWRAAQLAGLHEVPVILKNYNDKETLELAIVENIQREDLNPIEEAEAFSRLISEFKLSQQQVAEKVGKDRATIANAVRILSLPEQVRQVISSGELSVGHAKVLLSVPDQSKQIELAKSALNKKLSVRKLEKIIHDKLKGAGEEDETLIEEPNVTQRLISGLADELQKMLGTKVGIDYSQSKGKISIHFYSDDELTNLVDRLKQGWQ
jgi:ParB family chromosome partitioning protein